MIHMKYHENKEKKHLTKLIVCFNHDLHLIVSLKIHSSLNKRSTNAEKGSVVALAESAV